MTEPRNFLTFFVDSTDKSVQHYVFKATSEQQVSSRLLAMDCVPLIVCDKDDLQEWSEILEIAESDPRKLLETHQLKVADLTKKGNKE